MLYVICQLCHNKTITMTQPQLYSCEILSWLLNSSKAQFSVSRVVLSGRREGAGLKQNHSIECWILTRPNVYVVIEARSIKCNVDYFPNLVSDQFNKIFPFPSLNRSFQGNLSIGNLLFSALCSTDATEWRGVKWSYTTTFFLKRCVGKPSNERAGRRKTLTGLGEKLNSLAQ